MSHANPRSIVVVNPNSNRRVTRNLATQLAPWAGRRGVSIRCATVEDGPFGVQTQYDADAAVVPLNRVVAELEAEADGFVIACFSDPGVPALREWCRKPVLGIFRGALAYASLFNERIAVLALSQSSIARQKRLARLYNVDPIIAGYIPVNMTVSEATDRAVAVGKLVQAARQAKQEHAVDTVILGCAGFGHVCADVQQATGMTTIDPTAVSVQLIDNMIESGVEVRPAFDGFAHVATAPNAPEMAKSLRR